VHTTDQPVGGVDPNLGGALVGGGVVGPLEERNRLLETVLLGQQVG
jgi:hypothetical protein